MTLISLHNFDELVRAAVEAAPLPKTLSELAPEDLARFEAYARRRGITPEAALALARHAQSVALAEARHYDRIALEVRRSRPEDTPDTPEHREAERIAIEARRSAHS